MQCHHEGTKLTKDSLTGGLLNRELWVEKHTGELRSPTHTFLFFVGFVPLW
jgi:hypothetical protein